MINVQKEIATATNSKYKNLFKKYFTFEITLYKYSSAESDIVVTVAINKSGIFCLKYLKKNYAANNIPCSLNSKSIIILNAFL